MPRQSIGLAGPDTDSIATEIARLSELPLSDLRARWRTVFRRPAPVHLSRQLLFRTLAYRLQADRFGDLDAECRRVLERLNTDPVKGAARLVTDLKRPGRTLQTGTVLTREWNGQMHQVVVKPDGFQWDGKTYKSLSKVASAIAGSRWNGPRFFGFRDKPFAQASA